VTHTTHRKHGKGSRHSLQSYEEERSDPNEMILNGKSANRYTILKGSLVSSWILQRKKMIGRYLIRTSLFFANFEDVLEG